MKVLVYMKDGRTVYLLQRRAELSRLVTRQVEHEGDDARSSTSVPAVRGIWNPHTGEYVWTRIPLRYVAKGSIAAVEEARGLDEAVAMLKPDPDAVAAPADDQPTAEAVGEHTEGEGL